jgi:hypothetical protein
MNFEIFTMVPTWILVHPRLPLIGVDPPLVLLSRNHMIVDMQIILALDNIWLKMKWTWYVIEAAGLPRASQC